MLDRLLFIQGGACFFCKEKLERADASIEHLVAKSHQGNNGLDNCVACCKSINSLLGNMSIKDKVSVILNQEGKLKCPQKNKKTASKNAPKSVDHHVQLAESKLISLKPSLLPKTRESLANSLKQINLKEQLQVDLVIRELELAGKINISEDGKIKYQF